MKVRNPLLLIILDNTPYNMIDILRILIDLFYVNIYSDPQTNVKYDYRFNSILLKHFL